MKVAILGGCNSWKLAPFDDKTWKKWILGNQAYLHLDHLDKIDLIFEIHNDLSNREEGYAEWLVNFNKPLIVGDEFPIQGFEKNAKHVQVFNFEQARKILGGDFLTSTPAYMMAQCVMQTVRLIPGEKVTDIAIYGIDMAIDDREYFYEQPVMKEWIGYAKGIGIKIHMPKQCPLGKPSYIEGVTANNNQGIEPFRVCDFQALVDMHEVSKAEIDQQIEELRFKWATHDGCVQAYQRMVKVARAKWGGQDVKMIDTVSIL